MSTAIKASPSTAALRVLVALLSFGLVALVSSALHWAIAFSISAPPASSPLDLTSVTPARVSLAGVAILDTVARVALLYLAVARRDRPLRGLVVPCVVGGLGVFGLAASHAANAVAMTLLARSAGPSIVGEVSIATSLGGAIAQPLWWLGLAGIFVYCAVVVSAGDGAGGSADRSA